MNPSQMTNEMQGFSDDTQIKAMDEMGTTYEVVMAEYEEATNTIWLKLQEEG